MRPGFDATLLFALMAGVVLAWFVVSSDGSSLFIVVVFLTFAIRAALILAPAFSGGW